MRIILVMVLFGAGLMPPALADGDDRLDFEFFAAGGEPAFRSTQSQYPIILIEIERLSDPGVTEQNTLLAALDGETLHVLFVVACTEQVPRGRYHTSTTTARELRSAAHGLRVTILGPGGAVLERADHTLDAS